MKVGEIVKTPDGRIGRVESVDENGRTGVTDHGHVSYWALSVLAIATVADVFEYAGVKVPDGSVVCYDCSADNWFHTESQGLVCWWTNLDGGLWVDPIPVLSASWLGRNIDLSRLPASSAWGALPAAVRAAVEGVKK